MDPLSAAEHAQAQREIDFRLDGLCSSESARSAMTRLADALDRFARRGEADTPSARQARSVLGTVNVYLRRSLARSDLDGRVLLDTVNSLCWDRRSMADDDIPEDVLVAVDGPVVSPRDLLPAWRTASLEARAELAGALTWWAAAELVSNTVHLVEGEVEATLEPLFQAFTEGAASGPGRPLLN